MEQIKQQFLSVPRTDIEKNFIQEGGYLSPTPHLFTDIQGACLLRKPVLLKGPTGSGKTKLAQTISEQLALPMQSVNCSVDLDAEALLGFKTIVQEENGSEITFIDGPVIQAMKQGHLLYIDEINMAKPETLPLLHSVLDHRRQLTNPFTGEVITAHPQFIVIAAINEGYIGTTPMNEALKNRFIAFSIPYVEMDVLEQIILKQLPAIDQKLAQQALTIYNDFRKQVESGLLTEEITSVRSLIDALQLTTFMPLERALQYAIVEKIEDVIERKVVQELIRTWL